MPLSSCSARQASAPAGAPDSAQCIAALLLDLDGTLLDTDEMMFRAYRHALDKLAGVVASRNIWLKFLGRPLSEAFDAALAAPREQWPDTNALVQAYRSHLHDIHDEMLRTFPGILQMLDVLREKGIRLAIVTTKYRATVLRHLDYLGMGPLFDCIVTGDECSELKPSPQPFLLALDRLGVPAAQAAAVGDTRYDIEGGRAAGLATIAAAWAAPDRAALLAAGPDFVAEKPFDVLRILHVIG